MFTTINPIFSPEAIAFQNAALHESLTAIFESMRNSNAGKAIPELEMAIEKEIKARTNLNFEVEIGDYQMSTEPPRIDKNNPLMEGYGWKDASLSKQGLSDIRKNADKEVRGLLDPANSWVDGYFATMPPVRMWLNASMIFGNKGTLYKIVDGRQYTSGELSAIVIHEIGHIWSFLDFLVRFRTTNQILSSMVRQLDHTEDFGKREIILREAAEALRVDTVDSQALARKKNLTIYTVLVSNMARRNASQSGVEGYDINSFEALADQFATRHGAGRDLVTGLDKIYRGTIYRRGWIGYIFCEFMKLAFIGLGLIAAASGAVPGAYYSFLVVLSLLLADSHFDWYDKAGYRFQRVRNQMVENLKDKDLSKEDSARIRADIDAIDTVSDNYKDHTQLIGLFFDYCIPSGVAKRKDIEFQQNLEELGSNQLYYYANALKNV